MNNPQFQVALRMAATTDLSLVSDTMFDGCLLPGFQPIECTVEQVARLLQNFRFIGHHVDRPPATIEERFDMREVENIRVAGRTLFRITN